MTTLRFSTATRTLLLRTLVAAVATRTPSLHAVLVAVAKAALQQNTTTAASCTTNGRLKEFCLGGEMYLACVGSHDGNNMFFKNSFNNQPDEYTEVSLSCSTHYTIKHST